jgi:hypothetical protein
MNVVISGWDAAGTPIDVEAVPSEDGTVLVMAPSGGFRLAEAGVAELCRMVDTVDSHGEAGFEALTAAAVVDRFPMLTPLADVDDSPWEFCERRHGRMLIGERTTAWYHEGLYVFGPAHAGAVRTALDDVAGPAVREFNFTGPLGDVVRMLLQPALLQA